jgi:hypothetical protein
MTSHVAAELSVQKSLKDTLKNSQTRSRTQTEPKQDLDPMGDSMSGRQKTEPGCTVAALTAYDRELTASQRKELGV